MSSFYGGPRGLPAKIKSLTSSIRDTAVTTGTPIESKITPAAGEANGYDISFTFPALIAETTTSSTVATIDGNKIKLSIHNETPTLKTDGGVKYAYNDSSTTVPTEWSSNIPSIPTATSTIGFLWTRMEYNTGDVVLSCCRQGPLQAVTGNLGATNQLIYYDNGKASAGMKFYSGTSTPTAGIGNNGDIYFKYNE